MFADPIVILTDHHAALTAAAAYAAALAARLHVPLMVLPLAPTAAPTLTSISAAQQGAAAASGIAYLRLAQELGRQQQLPSATMASATEVQPADVRQVLSRYHPQLLVLNRPATAEGAIATRDLAAELLNHMPYPLLVVPANAPVQPIRHIAFGTDGGPVEVGEAAALMRQLLRQAATTLIVLHVAKPREPLHAAATRTAVTESALIPHGTQVELLSWLNPQPAEGVLEAARSANADLLVLVARRRSLWGALRHISVTADVVQRCPMPLLLMATTTE